jgi:hypothetical protein
MAEQTLEQRKPTAEDWHILKQNAARANAGDAKALEWLRDFLEHNPQVWQYLGDLARSAERAWIALISAGDTLAAEAIRMQLAQLKTDLIGEAPSVIEKLLGDQIVATLLEVKYLESVSAQAGGGSLTQAGLLLKRLESAQRRHADAIKTLLQVRKLLPGQNNLPGLRVFHGERATA